jgi:outer membrane protein assembly factor BamB
VTSPKVSVLRVVVFAFFAMGLVSSAFPRAWSQNVLTYHNNNARTGLNSAETTLTLSNVKSTSFGKLFTVTVDGLVDAEPLYLSAVPIAGSGTHNLLIVATENDSLYAFDADTGAAIWQITTLGAGETASDDRGCGQVTPEIGITSTPVISRPTESGGDVDLGSGSNNKSFPLSCAARSSLPSSPSCHFP